MFNPVIVKELSSTYYDAFGVLSNLSAHRPLTGSLATVAYSLKPIV